MKKGFIRRMNEALENESLDGELITPGNRIFVINWGGEICEYWGVGSDYHLELKIEHHYLDDNWRPFDRYERNERSRGNNPGKIWAAWGSLAGPGWGYKGVDDSDEYIEKLESCLHEDVPKHVKNAIMGITLDLVQEPGRILSRYTFKDGPILRESKEEIHRVKNTEMIRSPTNPEELEALKIRLDDRYTKQFRLEEDLWRIVSGEFIR